MTLEPGKPPRDTDDLLGTVPAWLVQWPMIAMTGWWDAVLDAWRPRPCPHHTEGDHDLAVPDPIEREGERSLFA